MKNSTFSQRMLVLLLFIFVVPPPGIFAQNWELRKETDGVKIYQRQTAAGHEIKLLTTFQYSLSAMVALFNNVADYPRWGYKVQQSRLLKRLNDNEFYYYQQFDFPWPLTDRDVVMHSRISQDPATHVVTLHSEAAPDYLPENDGFVRVRKANVQWTLTPLSANLIQAEYWLNSDPGGLLPDWTVNLAADTGPVQTVQNMKKVLAEEQYRAARLAYIKE